MDNLMSFLNIKYYDNTILDFILFGFFLFLGIAFKHYFSKLSSRLLFEVFRKHSFGLTRDDFYKLIKKPVSFLVLLIFVYIAFSNLDYPRAWHLVSSHKFGVKMLVEKTYAVLFIFAVVNVFRKMFDFLGIVMVRKAEQKDKKAEKQIISFVIESLKLAVLVIGLFILLGSVFDINVGTLIAGLGIGGVAVALAAKESLENLMGSFTIFADKPFVTGDLVKVGTTQGVVERVGFRSTRLRTLDKSFVTVPNKLIVDSEVDNLTERTTRRVTFTIGLRYDTTSEQMRKIMNNIKTAIVNHSATTSDCHVRFTEFGNSSLNILVLYFIEGNEYERFLQVNEEINFRIIEIVKEAGADFAFPSSSIYMEKNV
ncbi:MAG: Low conductance mechanosensitive channel YnaI [Bacteroidetes bacterium ADurb.Bin408]|nr:MAG: Low conductance mechanosensitive channel YnaI [Bacteroidetes bacterium ADurb.Bin408]